MFYSGIVVNNVDLLNKSRIHVYIPKLMPSLEQESILEGKIKFIKNDLGNEYQEDGMELDENELVTKNSILAYPFNFNHSQEHGKQIVPENGDIVSVFFMNDDFSQCFYMEGGSPFIKTGDYDLDYSDNMESKGHNHITPTSKVKQKVLYKSKNNTIVALDDNDNALSFIIKVNDHHKIKIEHNPDNDEILILTGGGNVIRLDDLNTNIEIKTTNGNKILLDDTNDSINIVSLSDTNITVGGNANIDVSGDTNIASGGNATIDIGGDTNITSGGNINCNASTINLN